LTPGQAADVTAAPELIEATPAEHAIGDKGYDSDAFISCVEATGAQAVIPPRSNRKTQRTVDWWLYGARNLVERLINRLKQCRRVATRYEKRGRNYLAFVHFACIIDLLR
jgi:transposase